MSFDESWEKNIYSRGKAANRYPFGELVPFIMRMFAKDLQEGYKPRVLELGFGAGNNLAFFAREGFEAYGIDGSASACELARSFLDSQRLTAQLTQGDFVKLPYADATFDLILDREAVYANRKAGIMKVAAEVKRCLKPKGRFLSFAYSTEHGSLTTYPSTQIEPGTYTFKEGTFGGTGSVHFFTRDEIVNEYFNGLEIEYLLHHRLDSLLPDETNQYAEFIVCGRKS